jgi:accessory gene regulator protein AgrB
MSLAEAPPLTYRLPVIGRVLRELNREPDAIWYLIVGLLSLLIIATKTWGLVVLSMTALTMVPVMFVLLILITRG